MPFLGRLSQVISLSTVGATGGCGVGGAKAVSDILMSAGGVGRLIWVTISRLTEGVWTLHGEPGVED